MSTEIKVTVKRPAPTSPANVRPVDPMKGTRNLPHTQPKLPPHLAKILLLYKAGRISYEEAKEALNG